MEEDYEYANELGKQDQTNLRNTKFTVNREHFSCGIIIIMLKNAIKHAPTHLLYTI